jgi:uncharacterized membrane protein YdjX (TVP38/TMEM64 family)
VSIDPELIDDSVSAPPAKGHSKLKVIAFLLLIALVATFYWQFGDVLTLNYLADQETVLRQYRIRSPWITAVLAMLIYIAVTGLSIPGATVLTLGYGWYFGFLQGLLIVSVGSTGGATVAFLLTRYFFRDLVQRKFSSRLQSVQDAMQREGAFYLFSLRLMPAIPFFLINVLMGLTRIHVATFWWVSQVGMLPATIAYVYAGSRFPSLQEMATEGVGKVLSWQLLLAFALIGILPLVLKWGLVHYKSMQKPRLPADN